MTLSTGMLNTCVLKLEKLSVENSVAVGEHPFLSSYEELTECPHWQIVTYQFPPQHGWDPAFTEIVLVLGDFVTLFGDICHLRHITNTNPRIWPHADFFFVCVCAS